MGGQLYGPDGLGELRGKPKRVELSKATPDPAVGRELWARSEAYTGMTNKMF
ncbi:hypothetical protein [Actinoplanes derwentensis]|uniref:hypothetical protein n=1 Tax=Actinoplanes derwentensis TaxID=113562 RepID=UPI0012FD66D0|nr:hypothetical protein [Actinoplanes derwentensis]GID88345.1 hypothetical protein Ade03nite_72690 [Actinoplanes derwentensis]